MSLTVMARMILPGFLAIGNKFKQWEDICKIEFVCSWPAAGCKVKLWVPDNGIPGSALRYEGLNRLTFYFVSGGFGEVGNDNICAGAFNGGEGFEHSGVFIKEAGFRGGTEHHIFT